MKGTTSQSGRAPSTLQKIQGYLTSCFLLTIPVLVWDLALSKKLPAAFQPETFWKDIPVTISYGENISRTLLFACLLLMPLHLKTKLQKQGMLWYVVGLLLYGCSWMQLIYFPNSTWSHNIAGFMAPAYTPICWLAPIALIGDRFYFSPAYTKYIFISMAVLFLIFHNLHTYLIYVQTAIPITLHH